MMAVEDLKTSELLDRVTEDIEEKEATENTDELMSRFPFDSIEELEKRIDALEAQAKRMQNHLHGQDGSVYTRAE